MTDDTYRLDTLPLELLIIIFDYCDVRDLIHLCQVCKLFSEIVRADILWIKKDKQPLVTNQVSGRFRERCNSLMGAKTKWCVSHNWQYGRYRKRELLPQKTKVMPLLHLTNNALWWCGGKQLSCFQRTSTYLNIKNHSLFDIYFIRDFSTFVLTKEFVITGDCNGNVNLWAYGNYQSHYSISCHVSDINAIDATSDIIVTGSDDHTIKIQTMPTLEDNKIIYPTQYPACINMMDRVWSLAADPTGTKLAAGSTGNKGSPPLQIFDIKEQKEYHIINHTWKRGAGILDIVWENPHTLLTCGYDTYIRKWDLRINKCVNAWPDPTDATLYCLSSDYQYTMIAGTQFNSMAVLWDQRQKDYIQCYYMKLGNDDQSPIYSLQFDNSYLYCATDRHLVELKFSGRPKEAVNYKIT